MTTILSFILVIGVLVFFHELGHFLAAKSVGVRIEKFYLGFNFFGLGWKKEYKGTEYGIGLFPLGGYVKLAGVIDESMDTEFSGAPDEFRSKNTLQKIWIMSAGVIMNFLLAILIFSHLTYQNGINEADPQAIVGQVIAEYPAENLGLKEGDQILSINGIKITDCEDMTAEIHQRPDEVLQLTWKRSGVIMKGSVTTESATHFVGDAFVQQGRIGIAPILNHRNITLIGSLKIGCERTWYILDVTYRSLMAIIKGNVSIKELVGPIMIAKMAGDTASSGGINALLGLMALLSVNFGLLNILPIPLLDGGHVLIALVEGLIQRELPTKVKLGFLQVGLFFFLLLFITIMVNDIQRLLQ